MTNHKVARVLLIEDSEPIQRGLKKLLSSINDCEVEAVAESEDRAIELLNASQFDILIIDIQLKSGSGLGILRFTQNLQSSKNCPLKIVLTNHYSLLIRQVCLETGAHYFFDKSKEVEQVAEVIEHWLPSHSF